MPVGASSSAYIPQASASSVETNVAPAKPDPKAMSLDSHLLVGNAFYTINQATSALDKLAVKLQDSKLALEILRKATYECVDTHSNSGRGALKKEATREDHQKYSHLLKEFGALEASIKQRTDGNSYFNTDLLLQAIKSQPLYDDFKGLMGPQIPAYKYSGEALVPPQQITEAFETIAKATSVLDEVTAKLMEFEMELKEQRIKTYEHVDVRADLVGGQLICGARTADHQNYIAQLSEFNALKTNIQDLLEGSSYFNTDSVLQIHESSPFYGDLEALNSGRSVPDFKYSYSSGSMDIDFSTLE